MTESTIVDLTGCSLGSLRLAFALLEMDCRDRLVRSQVLQTPSAITSRQGVLDHDSRMPKACTDQESLRNHLLRNQPGPPTSKHEMGTRQWTYPKRRPPRRRLADGNNLSPSSSPEYSTTSELPPTVLCCFSSMR